MGNADDCCYHSFALFSRGFLYHMFLYLLSVVSVVGNNWLYLGTDLCVTINN